MSPDCPSMDISPSYCVVFRSAVTHFRNAVGGCMGFLLAVPNIEILWNAGNLNLVKETVRSDVSCTRNEDKKDVFFCLFYRPS